MSGMGAAPECRQEGEQGAFMSIHMFIMSGPEAATNPARHRCLAIRVHDASCPYNGSASRRHSCPACSRNHRTGPPNRHHRELRFVIIDWQRHCVLGKVAAAFCPHALHGPVLLNVSVRFLSHFLSQRSRGTLQQIPPALYIHDVSPAFAFRMCDGVQAHASFRLIVASLTH